MTKKTITITELMADLGQILTEHGDVEVHALIVNAKKECIDVDPTEARPVWIETR